MTDLTSISCDRFDELLPELLEGSLAPHDRRAAELHQADCDRCNSLVRDLDGIRTEASALPALRPSRDLWSGIASRIEAPVVALVPRAEPVAARRRAPWRSVAAAAILVAATAGITHQLTVRAMAPERTVAAAASPGTNAGRVEAVPADVPAPLAGAVAKDDAPVPIRPPLPKDPPQQQRASAPLPSALASATPERRATAQPVGAAAASAVYDREVAMLRGVLEERRSALDPATIAILENNLTVIDRAILESREALRRDPASSLLSRQLDLALEKKLRLLRTAALLPSRS
jgi:hypothetical protein